MYFAKLVAGKTYEVMNLQFTDGVELQVDENVYDYLKGNTHFELREADGTDQVSLFKSNGEKYTEQDLKGLKKPEQEQLIRQLTKGDMVQDTKNEQERVALILKLQEEQE
ncbi:YqbF domain-containing protein [Bacillus mycoides]|uniref:Uncharacterized protein n=1 Tax=Bacillus cereus VD021 TaxID=1053224 RepID=R8GY11_BACCE|nr:YqbF domain-containing protein [Bacillus cereus]EOO65478.1 hypothetical protein IIC_06088 [Bacillus cereus VD021]